MVTNRFAARAAELEKSTITYDKDLPKNPSIDNGKELNLVDNTWEKRPLLEEEGKQHEKEERKKLKKGPREEYVTIKIKKTTHQNLELTKLIIGNNICDTVSRAVETWIQENLTSEQQLLLEQLQTIKNEGARSKL